MVKGFNKNGSGILNLEKTAGSLSFWMGKVISSCGVANAMSLGVCGESIIGYWLFSCLEVHAQVIKRLTERLEAL